MTDVRWRGILPSLPTPYAEGGEIDVDAFRRVVRFAIDRGAHGLVCFGLAGEVGRLTPDERERLLEAVVEEAAGAVPILTGATGESTAASVRLARHAERAGAAGIVLPPPTAVGLSEEHLTEFFATVAGATSLPVMIQHAPVYLGVAVRPELVLAAAGRAANVVAVKLEEGPEGVAAWRAALGPGFGLYGGNGGMYLLDCFRAGADGVMPGVDTVDLQVEVHAVECEGRCAEADELFARLLPLLVYEMQDIDHYNACAKHVLRRRGVLRQTDLRPPGPRVLSAASAARLDGYLERLGIGEGQPESAGVS